MKKILYGFIILLASCRTQSDADSEIIEKINNLKRPVTIISFTSGFECGVVVRDGNGKLIHFNTCIFNYLKRGETIR